MGMLLQIHANRHLTWDSLAQVYKNQFKYVQAETYFLQVTWLLVLLSRVLDTLF